jgi:hypothetical protein
MTPRWRKIQTVLNGTEEMRRAGELYLPKHEAETSLRYQERLESNILLNVTALTLDSWVGRPFSDPVHEEDVPEELSELYTDIDLQGNDVTVFAREWFREGLAKGFAHVLIDFPKVDREGRTLEDDRRENLRPYWSLVRPENLIAAYATVDAGHEVLVHARVLETVVERDGFEETTTRKIRVFDRVLEGDLARVYVSVWEERKERGRSSWVATEGPAVIDGVTEIPIVTFYAARDGLMLARPPLEDLADLNIRHWQSNSDQISVLTVARFPMLAGSGIQEGDNLDVGPKKFLTSSDPNGKFYYVEHSGAAIEAGRRDLLDLEEQMAHYGAEFLRKRPGNATATARALDSAEATTPLQDMTTRFNDALEQAVYKTAEWLKIEEPGTLSVATDFGPETAESADLSVLLEARKLRDLSREAFLAELKRRGVLADEFDAEEDEGELNGESMNGRASRDIDAQAEE